MPLPSSGRTLASETPAVPIRTGEGVWHREQVGPALPVCFSFRLSLILATNPDSGEFQMSNFLRNLG